MLRQEGLIHKRLNIVPENESLLTANIYNMEVWKKALTDLDSAYADLEMSDNIQKVVDAVYKRANRNMVIIWWI